ncbi:hypothetical protein N0O92_19510 [Alkalihalobacillus sp. MEB130]|uniref:hypothetical protein n=1 Tax=Alkalihalobacillus sp. MEB130 TaxID=2976704 RepID=UPI0028E02701|nr:hypothetical protein [Alkalihalobacillus sp. MEB130]MDT8862400.1 hypothetical protein [Alkalihalobacillus sp. MEB130]
MQLEKRLILARRLRISVLIVIAIALAMDYFPELTGGLFGRTSVFIILGLCFVLAVVAEILLPRKDNQKVNVPLFEHDLFFIFYVVAIIGLYTVLGGYSQIGLNFNHPVLWVFVVYALIKWNLDRKHAKKEKE